MADNFKEVYNAFLSVTNKTLERNKERSVVKFLNKTVKSLETVLSSIDTFLKSKGIDVNSIYDKSKAKGKSLIDEGNRILESEKVKGYKAKTLAGLTTIKSKLKDIFSGDDKDTGPPEEDKKDSKEPSEERKGWFEKLKERQDKRKAEVEEEKKSVQEKLKSQNKDSWLGKILSGMMLLGGFLVKNIGKLTGVLGKGIISSVKFLGGFLTKGFSKALFRLLPSLSGGIAKSLQSVVGNILKIGGKGLLSGGVSLVRGAISMAGTALPVLARGAAMIATGPIGWAVAAGTAIYAGYKLYKYLKRNDVADDIYGKLTKLRLYMYGFNDTKKEYFSKLFDLEMLMKDYVTFNDYKVQIKKLDKDVIEKVLELFNVTREEKDKYKILNNWFMKRFIPSYKAFIEALYSVNSNIYLDSIDKLKFTELSDFLAKFNIPTTIYNVTDVPSFDTNTGTLVSKEDVNILLTNISNEVKSKQPKEKTAVEKALDENKQKAAKQQQEQTKISKQDQKETNTTNTNQNKPPIVKANEIPSSPEQEGENKPNIKADMQDASAKVSTKLSKATGDLMPGGMSLEGITTKLDKQSIYNLDPNVRELFTGMAKEYNTLTGKDIPVNQAFRSYEQQEALYKKDPSKAAKPGNSTHEFGLALDISGDTVRELDKLGLLRKYGFSTSIGKEDWHIEPIGVTLNPTEAKNNLDFRMKAIMASPGNGGGGYGLDPKGILKKRNIPYQMSIYNSGSDNPIDVTKVAANSNDILGSKTSTSSSSSISKPQVSGTTTNENKQPTATNNQSNIPTTKTPIQTKEAPVPTLDKSNDVPNGVGENVDIAKYANLSPEEAVRQAAKMTGMDENTLITFAKLESSFNKNAKAKGPGMTASGLFGITDPTWKGLLDKYGSKYGIPKDADKNNPFYNSLMAAEYAKENLAGLKGYKEAKIEESTALYLAHHFGLSGANKIIKQINSKPDATMEESVSSDAFKNNYNELKGHTVSSYIQKVDNKIDSVAGTSPAIYKSSSSTQSKDSGVGITKASMSESSGPTTSSSQSSVMAANKPLATPKPSISNSRFDATSSINTTSQPTQSDSSSNQQYKDMFNPSKLENIMNNQLTALTQIASILTSIDGKFDLDKLAGNLTNGLTGNNKPSASSVDKSIPSTAIDLTRKALKI